MATKANLIVDQGGTFSANIDITDPEGNTITLSGYSGFAQIRRAYSSINTTASFTVSIDGNNGVVQLSLTANQTAQINSGRYVYDVQVNDPSNNIVRLVEGQVTVTPGVTQQNPANITIIVATSNISSTVANDTSGSGEV